MGRHSSATPPDAYPTRPDHEQDRGVVDVPVNGDTPDQGATAGAAVPPLISTVPDTSPVGWPERLADQPFGWAAAADLAVPAQLRREDPTEPTGAVGELQEPTLAARTPTEIEQAEEEHLDWLRNLPERRDAAPAEQHPPAHGRAEPSAPLESPRREWIERLVVGLIAGLVTFAATRWAGAGWSTAAWIGAAVLVVVPAAAWVATLGSRPSADSPPDGQPEH